LCVVGFMALTKHLFGHPPRIGRAKKAVEPHCCGSCSAPSSAVPASVSQRTSSALRPGASKPSCCRSCYPSCHCVACRRSSRCRNATDSPPPPPSQSPPPPDTVDCRRARAPVSSRCTDHRPPPNGWLAASPYCCCGCCCPLTDVSRPLAGR
jgi:hypothetical protein